MQLRVRSLSFAVAVGLAMVAGGSSAKADFLQVFVLEGDTVAFNAIDNVFGDTNPAVGAITVDVDALNLALTNYQFRTLGASSNATTGTPFSGQQAQLFQEGNVFRSTGGPADTLTVVATDTGFTFPTGSPKQLGTLFLPSFTGAGTGSVQTLQSFLDEADTELAEPLTLPPPGAAGDLLTYSSTGLAQNGANLFTSTFVDTDATSYALSSVATIDLTSGTGQFTASTTVVPEPATMTLMALGLPALGLVLARRKARA